MGMVDIICTQKKSMFNTEILTPSIHKDNIQQCRPTQTSKRESDVEEMWFYRFTQYHTLKQTRESKV